MNIQQNILESTEISFSAKAFLHTAASCCSKYQDEIWYSQDRLAKMMSCSRRTVQRAVRELLELKLISVQRRWLRTNIYRLHCLVRPKVINNGDTVAHRTNSGYKYNDTSQNASSYSPECPTAKNDIVREIESVIGSSKDRACWSLIARKCSPDVIYAGLSALRIAMSEKIVHRPAAYLVATVKGYCPNIFHRRQPERPIAPIGANGKNNTDTDTPANVDWETNLNGVRAILAKLNRSNE